MEARRHLKWNGIRFGQVRARSCSALGAASVALMLCGGAHAQVVKAPRYSGGLDVPAPQPNLPPLPAALTPHGTVVEDVVVRVNDQIITRSDVERAVLNMEQENAQNNINAVEAAQRQKDMLRDMIDQQLLLSRAKELGLNADADVIRKLDEIRKQYKMDTMDDLEKAAKQQGISFEDFKAQIRNQILTQQVVRDEVGRRLQVSQAEKTRYYDEHKKDFEQPEQIQLSEILVPLPETATPAEIAQAEKKADGIKSQVMQGSDFSDLAKKVSGGPTAPQGGDLGMFKRGALAKVLEDDTFSLKVGESTQPIRTRQGFVILKVTGHHQAGPAPMADVEPQMEEALYMQAMQPALRTYLTRLRSEAYIDLQPGFVDSGASGKETKPVFTAYAPPVPKKKVVKQTVRYDRSTGRYTAAPSRAVVASPDSTGTRTITGPEAKAGVDPATGLAVMPATTKTASARPSKGEKKEKVRFGQAPRNALPAGTDEVASAAAPGAVGAAATTGATPESAGTANLDDNPLTPQAPPKVKSRFSSRAREEQDKKAKTLSAKQLEKVNAKPAPLSADELAAAKVQAAPLGLAGDTSKKAKKPAKVKGAPKERLEEKKPEPKAVETPVDQTANPALAPTSDTPPSTRTAPLQAAPGGTTAPAQTTPGQSQAVPNSSVPRPASNVPNDTTLPPVTQPVPGSQTGTPVPTTPPPN